mgnify:CR=1 FL=1
MVVGIPRHYQLGDAMKDFDDKDLVIFAVTIICLASIFWLPEAKEIVLNIITGLMGIAVGQKIKS